MLLTLPRKLLEKAVDPLGYQLTPKIERPKYPVDLSPEEQAIVSAVEGLTLTSAGAVTALIRLVRHVVEASIPGDLVECGVWKGGSSAAIARTLLSLRAERRLWLYDVFGVFRRTTDDAKDVNWKGETATLRGQQEGDNWGGVPLGQVQVAMQQTGYPTSLMRYVAGYVEDTIPHDTPDRIALLRLDTDFYESTLHELRHFYPRLSSGGVLIVDDYGCWKGSRIAADEYFAEIGFAHPLFIRLDAGPVALIKP